MERFVVISGCSGGGKLMLVAELARCGYVVVEEPGRRIVREEREGGGAALPWVDGAAFARRAVATAFADREEARLLSGWVFFDRGRVDASVALEHLTGEPTLARIGRTHRYHRRVFLAPPWPEIFVQAAERFHKLDDGGRGRLNKFEMQASRVLRLTTRDNAGRTALFIGRLTLAAKRKSSCVSIMAKAVIAKPTRSASSLVLSSAV